MRNVAKEQRKSGPLRGAGTWKALETVGDCQRFFRWTILALKAGKLDRADASVLGQLGTYLLRAIEGHDVERRMADLEARYAAIHQAAHRAD
jgi:hypothetical protein